MRAIIFDFDGVIHDTFEYHLKHINEVSSVPVSAEEYRSAHDGNFYEGDDNHPLTGMDWKAYDAFMKDRMPFLWIDGDRRRLLVDFAQDHLLFIISSSHEGLIKEYLRNNQVDGLFKAVMGKETHTSKVEKFRMLFDRFGLVADDCVFVTDTVGDVLEAKVIGVRTIALDFGFHDRERLEKVSPDIIVSSVGELRVALQG